MSNPNTAVTAPKQSALAVMASRYSVEPAKLLTTLKNTVFKGATDDELLALVVVANEYGLNPFLKQIYAFPGRNGGITPVVSIDGWIAVMNRQPDFDGIEFVMEEKDGKPVNCTAVISVKGRSKPVKVTEYMEECYRNTDPWKSMPRRMLRHKATSQGVRVAFGMSGIYDEDEARVFAADPLENAKLANAHVVEPTPQSTPPADKSARADDQVPGAEVPPATKPAQGEQTPIQRDVKLLRMLLKTSGFTDGHILNLWRDNGLDESLASIDEVAEMKPAFIRAAVEPWKITLEGLKLAASGGAK